MYIFTKIHVHLNWRKSKEASHSNCDYQGKNSDRGSYELNMEDKISMTEDGLNRGL